MIREIRTPPPLSIEKLKETINNTYLKTTLMASLPIFSIKDIGAR